MTPENLSLLVFFGFFVVFMVVIYLINRRLASILKDLEKHQEVAKQCPPHQWVEDEKGNLICARCHFRPSTS